MENKSIIPLWVSVLLAFLCVGALCLNIFFACTEGAFIVNYVLFAVSTLFALFYCIHGFGKKPQLFYRISIASYGVAEIAAAVAIFIALLIAERLDKLVAVSMALYLLEATLLFAVGFGKDIGKKASDIIAVIILVFVLINAVINYISFGMGPTAGMNAASLVLSVVLLIMVHAKYKDKAARGSF